MKKLLLIVFSLSFLSSCSNDKDFFVTKENALISCGGKSRIIENENEEIINTEVKDLIDGFYLIRKNKSIQSSYSYECKSCTIKRVKSKKKVEIKRWEYPDW